VDQPDSKDEIKSYCREVGQVIAKMRRNRGIAQDELAHLAGFSRGHIGIIERGEKALTIWTLKRLADALKTTPSKIFAEAGF